MDRPSSIKTGENKRTPSLPNNTQDIVKQDSNFSRASKAIEQYNLSIEKAPKTFFSQCDLPILSQILFDCDLGSILALRLVSKGFYFASTQKANCLCCALADKAAISFRYQDMYNLNRSMDRSIQEKFNFAKENTEICIISSMNYLLCLSSMLNFRLGVILNIENLRELNRLQLLLEKQPETKIIGKIKGLNCERLEVNASTDVPINEFLTKNLIFLPGLTTLLIANIRSNINFILPDSLHNLSHFTISGTIFPGAAFTIPNSLNHLNTLTIGNISQATLRLPASLESLTVLTIGNIDSGSTFALPNTLNSLTTLTIGNIGKGICLKLLGSLNNLKTLIVGNIPEKAILELPDSLDNLTTLQLGNIALGASLKLPTSFKSLENFTVGIIDDDSIYLQVARFT